MCGICGIVGDENSEVSELRVRGMMQRLIHRGPDGEGLLSTSRVVLGIRRLSIVDLEGGSQPIYNEAGDVGVVFNGELYNFLQLRELLQTHGHRFRTRSDTEVLVHAYEEWGDSCVERLRGMFAFAVWDGRDTGHSNFSAIHNHRQPGKVFLARDRLGIKPLYYSVTGGKLLFASEVRALLAAGLVDRRLDPRCIEAYLLFGSVVEPMTLIEGVFSLPPGHCLTVDCHSPSSAQPRTYWELAGATQRGSQNPPQDLAAAARELRPRLEEAVRSHLQADVPVGVFLSSGLDSASLAALAAREHGGIQTFTVSFAEDEFSEAPAARQIATKLGTKHVETLVTADDMLARIENAVEALDQPSMDGVNTFYVSWAAHEAGLKVALSGLGGDEVFGGYPTFRFTRWLAVMAAVSRRFPEYGRTQLSSVLIGISRNERLSAYADVLRKVAALWNNPDALPHPYFYGRILFTPRDIERIMPGASVAPRDGNTGPENTPWWRWLVHISQQAGHLGGDSGISCLELRTYMLDTLLRDTDAVSMHHSLEVRVPLLDHPLVEYVAALPDGLKRRRGISKALLAEAVADLLPPEIACQSKRTFTFPWQRWLRGTLGAKIAVRLGDLTPSLAALFSAEGVQSAWRNFLLGRTGWARPWSLFVLNEWVRRNVDEPQPIAGTTRSAAGATVS